MKLWRLRLGFRLWKFLFFGIIAVVIDRERRLKRKRGFSYGENSVTFSLFLNFFYNLIFFFVVNVTSDML